MGIDNVITGSPDLYIDLDTAFNAMAEAVPKSNA